MIINAFLVRKACRKLLIMLKWSVVLTVCSYHVTFAFQSESALYSCLKVKDHLCRNRHEISGLSDCNKTRTHDHLVFKRTLNHLAKLAKLSLQTKWLWVQVLLQSLECCSSLIHPALCFIFCSMKNKGGKST